ncbi:MAG: PQQ-dependent sugar dehydrogenase [Gammaproteobacteria bacterium]|nr:PQQ-dependent sugar dehydrogenase [Gammaproteobacteria bacterium]
MLDFDSKGTLLIGAKSDQIYRLSKPYRNPEALVKLTNYPHSIAFRNNEIFIATSDALYQAPYIASQKIIPPVKLKKYALLPSGRGHSSRTVRVGPDKRVYISIGISGNCSDQYLGPEYSFKNHRGGVMVLNENLPKPVWEAHASGLRNPVGFDWHPETGDMYLTNNGPDHLGFDQPPEYFSRAAPGSFHGMPWFYFDGKSIQRDDCINSKPPRQQVEVEKPVLVFPSRNAPLGMAFVPLGGMDKRFEFDAIVALHGSWATQPKGSYLGDKSTRREPKLVIVRFENGRAQRIDDLVTGFQLNNGTRLLRPAGVIIGPDGDVYFTSDGGLHGLFRLRRLH